VRAAPDSEPLGDDEIEIEVRAAGLNFRDVMYAMGCCPTKRSRMVLRPTLGMESVGHLTRVGPASPTSCPADAVIAFAPASFGNRVAPARSP